MFWIELLLACALAGMAVVWRPWLEPPAARLARKPLWCLLLIAAPPVVLRLILLPHHPAPTPDVYDEFGHLLVADTLRHFRLANPANSFSRFFETFFVLQQPTYSSIYPLGQGLVLALGWTIFGHPWAGVLMATAAFCGLCYWMLRGWTTPGWALAGGLLAVVEFGPLSQWMNSYWGGAAAASAGCLVFGALPRFRQSARLRDGAALGIGLGLHLLIRPFESLFLFLAAAAYLAPLMLRPKDVRRLVRPAAGAAAAVAAAALLMGLQNHAVTGKWTTLPEALSMYQYGVPSSLTFQPNPTPHRDLTPEQAMDYQMQLSFHGPTTDTLSSYLLRLEYRVRYYRFFFLPPLYIALVFFLPRLREPRFAWVAATALLFVLGTNFFPAFQVHYIAACTCLFVLMSVAGLETLNRISCHGRPAGEEAARVLLLLCLVHFGLWYGVHLADDSSMARALRPYETWDALNHGNPERRILVRGALDRIPGKLLVFVRYSPRHIFQDEWVYNGADISGERIIWARDLGSEDNRKLAAAYSGRTILRLDPDERPPQISPYNPALEP